MPSRSLRRLVNVLLSIQLVRFLGVGFTATATDFVVFNLALIGVADPSPRRVLEANLLAFACATLVGYVLNARLTFRARRDRRSLLRYVLVVVVGAVIYNGTLLLLVDAIDPANLLLLNLLKAAAVVLSATWNFCGFAFFAFRSPPTPVPATVQREVGL